MKHPRVAIVADWIIGGGAERVVQQLHTMYPDAPIYASYCTPEWRKRLDNKVVTGYLQNWPFSSLRKFAGLISPFRISWYKNIDFSDFDIVISATGNGDAKHIRPPKGVTHIAYCFTPVHYYWRHYQMYLTDPGFGFLNPLARLGLRLFVKPLRRKDYEAAQRVDHFIAISDHIKDDIQTYYNRDSAVISPPVDTERFANVQTSERSGYVTMGRQVPHKHTSVVVDACTKLNVPLTVIGNGPDHDNLVQRAGSSVTFLTNVSDSEMPEALARHEAFLFASIEDFGIAPVEAMAAGTPVIAIAKGGALDYVNPGKSGLLFQDQTVASLTKAIQQFQSQSFNPAAVRKQAEQFSSSRFAKAIISFVSSVARDSKEN
ncbi:glycosyltransferase family 4 protein [Candidatus Saccharibacteria bacterium]|nr:MAG: glycosyltransferase family 4 protein [Candidatus Saccharibacteria bacterium]